MNQTDYSQGATGSAQPTTPTTPPAPSSTPVIPPTYQTAAAQAAQTAAPTKNGSGKMFVMGFAGAAVACILAIIIAVATNMFGMGGKTVLGATNATTVEAATEEATLAEAVANKCLPSVASIVVLSEQQQSMNIYDYLFGNGSSSSNNSGELVQSGLGSGVVLSEDGYIITNSHVVSGGSKYRVTLEGEVYEADLVGEDETSDIAIIKITDGNGFTPIEVGDSDAVRIGEWVMTIGSPFGLEQSVATGIISATGRSQIMSSSNGSSGATIYPNLIQTDAAINPGNSGGALVNASGQLIGINTLITSYSGNYSGVGFAIPSNYAISLAQNLIEGKEPTHAQLGVNLVTVDKATAQRYGFKTDKGAYISNVAEGSGAEKAGLQVGDIITKFDGKEVTSANDLTLAVRAKNPGDTVSMTIVNRDGETKDVQATLGSAPNETNSSSSSSANSQNNGSGSLGNIFGR